MSSSGLGFDFGFRYVAAPTAHAEPGGGGGMFMIVSARIPVTSDRAVATMERRMVTSVEECDWPRDYWVAWSVDFQDLPRMVLRCLCAGGQQALYPLSRPPKRAGASLGKTT